MTFLCSARVAFGQLGFLQFLQRAGPLSRLESDPRRGTRERDLTIARLEESGRYNTCLVTPVDPVRILEIARTGVVVLPWSIPVLPARGTLAARREPEPRPPRVLIIDDDEEAQALDTDSQRANVEIDIAHDAWTALDYLALKPPDLILCSASLKAGTSAAVSFAMECAP